MRTRANASDFRVFCMGLFTGPTESDHTATSRFHPHSRKHRIIGSLRPSLSGACRFTVAETGWLTPRQFAIGVGFAYATPGPILILAAFVGYYVAGVPGALAGTFAVFAIPVALAAGSAGIVQRLNRYARFRAFARF